MFPLLKSIQSFIKAKLIPVVLMSIIWAIALVTIAFITITWLSNLFIDINIEWLDKVVKVAISIVTGIGGWFMIPVMIPFVAGIFLEKIIHKVEVAYYPKKIRNEEPKFWPDLVHDLKFLVWALFLNILILPLYLFGIGFLLSIILNTYLLGREFFESAAGYHLGKPTAKKLGKKNKTSMYIGGFVFTLLSITPFINVFVPIFAVIWMTHVYHSISFDLKLLDE